MHGCGYYGRVHFGWLIMTMTCSRNSCGRLTWLTVLYVQVKSLISMATTDSGGPIPHRRTSMREPSVT